MLNIDEGNTTLAKHESRSGYAARLAAALGNGADWEFTGQVTCLQFPTGVCACGHNGLKYLFFIQHRTTGASLAVGSSCIETYQDINPEMVGAIQSKLAELRADHAETIRKAKESAGAAEVQALALAVSAKRLELFQAVASMDPGRWLPPTVWRLCHSVYSARLIVADVEKRGEPINITIPAMKTARGQIARLNKMSADYDIAMAELKERLK